MKVILFNYKDRRKTGKFNKSVNFERFLFKSFIAVFVLLLAAQAALLNPAVRSAITIHDGVEGTPLGAEEYLYNEGNMKIELLDGDSNPDLKVLVNGEEKACFEAKSVQLDVIEGDVIEVDGSAVTGSIRVAVSSVSTNMDGEYVGKTFKLNGNVQRIIKVKMNGH